MPRIERSEQRAAEEVMSGSSLYDSTGSEAGGWEMAWASVDEKSTRRKMLSESRVQANVVHFILGITVASRCPEARRNGGDDGMKS